MKTFILSTLLFLSAATLFAQSTKTVTTTAKSTSVTVTNSDQGYRLTASFDKDDSKRLKLILTDRLGSGKESANGGTIWKLSEVYEVNLQRDKLSIMVDKGKASGSLSRSFSELGESITQAINSDNQPPKTPDH